MGRYIRTIVIIIKKMNLLTPSTNGGRWVWHCHVTHVCCSRDLRECSEGRLVRDRRARRSGHWRWPGRWRTDTAGPRGTTDTRELGRGPRLMESQS